MKASLALQRDIGGLTVGIRFRASWNKITVDFLKKAPVKLRKPQKPEILSDILLDHKT